MSHRVLGHQFEAHKADYNPGYQNPDGSFSMKQTAKGAGVIAGASVLGLGVGLGVIVPLAENQQTDRAVSAISTSAGADAAVGGRGPSNTPSRGTGTPRVTEHYGGVHHGSSYEVTWERG